MVDVPEPVYVKTSDGTYIAYQVFGDGPIDIAWQFDFYGNIDVSWLDPFENAWWSGLASFSRVILHDRRATGLSSRNVPPPNLETRAADLRDVLDAAGCDRAVIGGWLEGLTPAILLAASDPDRVRSLVWWGPAPRVAPAPDYPWGQTADQHEREMRSTLEHWGTIEYAREWARQHEEITAVAPPDDEIRALGRACRNTCTPDVATELVRIWFETDVRAVLPSVQVPTLLISDAEDKDSQEIAEHVASLMPKAERRILPQFERRSGEQRAEVRRSLEEIRRFIGIDPPRAELDTILSSVLFTDIVGSTERQASLGDRAWKELVEHHHDIVRDALDRWRGVEHDTAGDGFYATFDGPARAIRCALEVIERVRHLGIEVRAGVHTGECELIDGKVGGLAVSIGARIAARSGPSEVLASQTVKDLVAGSGFSFQDAGEQELKGVPERWRLFRVEG